MWPHKYIKHIKRPNKTSLSTNLFFFSLKYKGPSKHKCAFYTFFFFFHISNITFIYRGKVPLAVGHISHGFWTILWTSITTWHRASVAALPHQSLTPCCPQHNSTGHVHSLSKSASSKLMTVKAAERALNGFCWFYHIIKCIFRNIPSGYFRCKTNASVIWAKC